jgi:gamma-glutamyltranspeptidase/glutathione hydrolase
MGTTATVRTAAIATPHPAAAAAGRQIFVRGGNAVDAAVGAMLACCVAMPGSVGLGGYGGSLVAYLAVDNSAVAVGFDARAPRAYQPEPYAGQAQAYELGYLAVTVPAVPAGLDLALTRFGTLPWAVVSQPAISLADKGIPVSAELQRELENWTRKTDPASLRALFPHGEVPQAGTVWVQPDMARLLRTMAEEGPGTFYRGEIAARIVQQVRDHGGILAEEDFAQCQAEVVMPLGIDYRGCRVLTPPPPSGGVTSLQILKSLEPLNIAGLPRFGAEYFHQFAEAAKRAWQYREKHLGDPDHMAIPAERLLAGASHTVNVLAADPTGNVVSLTATHGALYGSTVVIDGLGLVMGHGMSRFDLAESSPNAPAAGKRMLHNMAPVVLLDGTGRACGAVGLPGGRKIVTVTAQLVVNLVDLELTPLEAIRAPRVHIEVEEPLAVSSAVPDAVIDELRALGHMVRRGQETGGPAGEIGGVANALRIDPGTREITVASQAGEAAALRVEV